MGTALLVLVIIAGFAFANSISVTNVTNNAKALHWTNAAMGTSALARAGLVQAVTFGELEESELVARGDFAYAMEQLGSVAAELHYLDAAGQGRASRSLLTRFTEAVDATVAALEAGDFAAAKESIVGEVELSYMDLSRSLGEEQGQIRTAIDENSADGQALNGWIVFALTLGVPGAAVISYFLVARRQVQALREQNRLELEAERTISRAKDSFIAGLSHELRTPLTSIYGFAEVLSDGVVQGREATEETAGIIANEAAEMTRLVDDLLAASRLESTGIEVELAPTRVQDVIESALAPFERAGLVVSRAASSAMAQTDASRLRHVLVNLISNAARHGGPQIGIEVSEAEDVVDIEVWDNGPGVAQGQVDRIFDRFVHDGTAPLLTGSVGLGLAVASRLAGIMGGKLEYQRFGAKTYFVVTLPRAEQFAHAESRDEEETVAAMIKALAG